MPDAWLQIATPRGALAVRPEAANGTDEPFLFDLYASVRADEFVHLPLDSAAKTRLLRLQFDAMRRGYRADFPAARFEVVTLDQVPIGNIITDVDEHRVLFVDIALLPTARRFGLATALMRALLAEPARLDRSGHVSVMMHNAASLALCRRLGFTIQRTSPPFILLEWRA